MDDSLTFKVAVEELFDVHDKSEDLGILLGLKKSTVTSIHAKFCRPIKRFREVLLAFLQQTEQPTWEVIVEALKDPSINNSRLAESIEKRFCSRQTGTQC